MNILLIPNNDWINHPVPAQRHYRIFEELGKRHKVYVLQFDIFKQKSAPTHIPEHTQVVRAFTIPSSNPTRFYITNLLFQSQKIFSAIKQLDIDVVFGSNLAVCSSGFEAAKLLKAKRIFDLSDYLPASAQAYFSNPNGIVPKVVSNLATIFMQYNIRNANVCTTCSSTLKEFVAQTSPKTRVEQLPNGVDTSTFLPRPPNEQLRDELELEDNVLVYVGSIESWMDFEIVLDAVSLLKDEHVNVQLLLIGRSIYSKEENPIARSIKKRKLEKQVKFLNYKPYHTLPDYINLSKGGLLPFKPGLLLTEMAFPNKLVEYLACGKPVFAPAMRELRKVGGKFLLEYNSPKTLAVQMKKALSTDYDSKAIHESVRDYDWGAIAGNLELLMEELIARREAN
jgi:glycosyltransferase involved in cell wall biosynthesis